MRNSMNMQWPWRKENYNGWLGMAGLTVLALASILLSAWGMLGFRHLDFIDDATPKTQAIILTLPDCKECSAPDAFVAEFEGQGYVVATKRTVDAASSEGKKLIAQYSITKLPTVLFRKNSEASQAFLNDFGDKASDGTFVLREIVPPYRDVATNTTKGRFGIILLADKACKECYDVALHKTPLARLGMTPTDEKMVDVADKEGKELIEKYRIETVPTLIMQGDLIEYKSLEQVWDQVGTIEADGSYVFRKGQDSMGVYKILKTGEIKKPAA